MPSGTDPLAVGSTASIDGVSRRLVETIVMSDEPGAVRAPCGIDAVRPDTPTAAPDGARTKLRLRGPRALTPAELLQVVIGGASRCASPGAAADRLLRTNGIDGLAAFDAHAWRKHAGIGPVAASRITAAFELGRRAASCPSEGRPPIARPGAAYRHVRHLGRAKKEHLVGLYLDAQNGLLHRETISIGSLNTTRTHPREILHPAILHMALGFILAHNHPSGSLDPSPEDLEFTRQVARAGEIMGIELYDHLIVAGERFVSLRERGVL